MKVHSTIGLAVIWFCAGWSASAWSAPSDGAPPADPVQNAAYQPGQAYKKSIAASGSKIPGSSSTIPGSRSRSYVRPKKVTYQEHMRSLGSHRFKSPENSFGAKKLPKSTLLSQRSPGTSKRPASRLKIQKSIGRSGPGINRMETLNNSELVFLDQLTQAVRSSDPAAGSRLARITAAQKRGQKLSKDEYDFLNAVATKVDDGQASYRLRGIAEKRRDKSK